MTQQPRALVRKPKPAVTYVELSDNQTAIITNPERALDFIEENYSRVIKIHTAAFPRLMETCDSAPIAGDHGE